jgi:hypothetical protein
MPSLSPSSPKPRGFYHLSRPVHQGRFRFVPFYPLCSHPSFPSIFPLSFPLPSLSSQSSHIIQTVRQAKPLLSHLTRPNFRRSSSAESSISHHRTGSDWTSGVSYSSSLSSGVRFVPLRSSSSVLSEESGGVRRELKGKGREVPPRMGGREDLETSREDNSACEGVELVSFSSVSPTTDTSFRSRMARVVLTVLILFR